MDKSWLSTIVYIFWSLSVTLAQDIQCAIIEIFYLLEGLFKIWKDNYSVNTYIYVPYRCHSNLTRWASHCESYKYDVIKNNICYNYMLQNVFPSKYCKAIKKISIIWHYMTWSIFFFFSFSLFFFFSFLFSTVLCKLFLAMSDWLM